MTPRIRVLVVDDDAFVAKAIVRVLSAEFDVAHAPSGAAALERLARGERFDVILCDVLMPGMDGVQLYDRLDDATKRQVVFMTGGVYTERLHQRLRAVARSWLEKPIDGRELRLAVMQRARDLRASAARSP